MPPTRRRPAPCRGLFALPRRPLRGRPQCVQFYIEVLGMRHSHPIALARYELPGEPPRLDDGDSLDSDKIIRFIRSSWRLCLIWLATGLCAGIAFLVLSPSYYSAFTVILFEDGAARPAGASAGTDAVASAYIDTQVQVLQSGEVVGRVVDQNRLVQDEEFGGGAAATNPEIRHATILRVAHALSVRRIGVSNAVEI